MISSRPYQEQHLEGFRQKEIFSQEGEVRARLKQLSTMINVAIKSIFLDEELIGIIGVNVLFPGTGEVWSVLSESVKKSPIGFHREVLRQIQFHEDTLKLHRMQMTVREDYPDGQRWAESLGFQKEGLLRQFSPDKISHFMYSRVK